MHQVATEQRKAGLRVGPAPRGGIASTQNFQARGCCVLRCEGLA